MEIPRVMKHPIPRMLHKKHKLDKQQMRNQKLLMIITNGTDMGLKISKKPEIKIKNIDFILF